MSYNGYLLKVGGSSGLNFPFKFMKAESYDAILNAQDLDSDRNAIGYLKRNVLDHVAGQITFKTPPMWNDDFEEMMNLFRSHYISKFIEDNINPERKLIIEAFYPEINGYHQGEFYLVTPKPQIDWVKSTENRLHYLPMQIELIQY